VVYCFFPIFGPVIYYNCIYGDDTKNTIISHPRFFLAQSLSAKMEIYLATRPRHVDRGISHMNLHWAHAETTNWTITLISGWNIVTTHLLLMTYLIPSGYLTVRRGIDGPNRNRWFTVLKHGGSFHGKLLNSHGFTTFYPRFTHGACRK